MNQLYHLETEIRKRYPDIRQIVVYEKTASTMDIVTTLMRARAPELVGAAVLCIALGQTAGRGRQGRHWKSSMGAGVYLSLGYCFQSAELELSLLPLAVGAALCEELRTFSSEVFLKWPNDLVFKRGARHPVRKLGGVLIESQGTGIKAEANIGVGVNISSIEGDNGVGLEEIVGITLNYLDICLRIIGATLRGCSTVLSPEEVVRVYESYNVLQDRPVRYRDVLGGEASGIVTGVALDGALRVMTTSGERLLYSSDVHLL